MGRVAAFVAIAFAWSWAWWLPLTITGRPIDFGEPAPAYLAGVPGPLIAAVVVTVATKGPAGLRELLARIVAVRVALRWFAVAVLVPVGLFAVALLIMTVAGAPLPTLDRFGVVPGLPATSVLVVWIYAVFWTGWGEETGWRGYALPRLQERFTPLVATAVLSAIWAAWHLPLLPVLTSFAVIAQPAMLPIFWFGLFCLSVVLTWLYTRSGASILVVALWHGTYNVAAGTLGAQGGINVAFTVFLMVWAAWLVISELRARRAARSAV